jgi:hypothetical protein
MSKIIFMLAYTTTTNKISLPTRFYSEWGDTRQEFDWFWNVEINFRQLI